ncbi:hypothetical protein QBC35DRAFT_189365 [Podospora australis]|uniref:Uncharacterized protein n=1 Tax=Podospora australis TaxID=1536484 RepID=A0AAN6WUF2_9PEZI|nr:hypothetical protein QBC35DRAFT_189365 [Podospora australis]
MMSTRLWQTCFSATPEDSRKIGFSRDGFGSTDNLLWLLQRHGVYTRFRPSPFPIKVEDDWKLYELPQWLSHGAVQDDHSPRSFSLDTRHSFRRIHTLLSTMGQRHSIIQVCQLNGKSITKDKCTIEFDESGSVRSFGGMRERGFEGDPDIAGKGVVTAFMVLGIIVCAMGFYRACLRGLELWKSNLPTSLSFIKPTDRHLKGVDDLILNCTDGQLLLIVAFIASYDASSQCEISLYHNLVAIHIIMAGLCTALLSFVLVQRPHVYYLSSLARLGLFAFGLFNLFTLTENFGFKMIHGRLPDPSQEDSLILLPAYCTIEAELNPLPDLTPKQQRLLYPTGPSRDIMPPFIIISGIYMFTAAITIGATWLATWYRRFLPLFGIGKCARFYIKMGVWITCTCLIIWNWVVISSLRRWVGRSKWLEQEGKWAENDIKGFGQMGPLVALGTIGFTLLNGIWELIRDWRGLRWVSQETVQWTKVYEEKSVGGETPLDGLASYCEEKRGPNKGWSYIQV